MRFILLVSFVFASPIFRRNDAGLLDGLLGDDDLSGDLLNDGGLLGTGIGGKRGLLGTGLLGNNGMYSKHRSHGHRGYYGKYNDYDNDNYYQNQYENYGY